MRSTSPPPTPPRRVETRANGRANAGKARDYIGRNPQSQAVTQIPAATPECELPLTSVASAIVLDTNVVLDWLLFGNPGVAALCAAVQCGRLRWLATPAMRHELALVLARGLAAAHRADERRLLQAWDDHAQMRDPPPPHRLRCTDPDDQKFVDLAFASGARWLVSRDRAVLRLSRRAAPLGLGIVTPERWHPDG